MNKKTKQILSFMLSLIMIMSMFAGLDITSFAEADILSFLTYEINDGEVTITDCDSSISGDITIPDTIEGYPVTTIGDYAFGWCDSLTSATIPASVTTIHNYAFYDCSSLTSIIVDENNENYSNDKYGVLFNKDKTELIQYPICNSREGYSIPNSVTTIGDEAFRTCDSLTSVTLPNSVTTIDDFAFADCSSLTSVTIPASVTSIGNSVFAFCISLESITVDKNNSNYSSDEYSVLFNKDKTELIQYPIGNSKDGYLIPDSVTTIDNYAFYDCSNLTSVTIPDSVTSIGNSAFYDCSNLTSVTIPDSVTSIGNSAFYWCTSLTSATIGDSVTTIGDEAFSNCISLTEVKIPGNVTTIGKTAFYACHSITSFTVDENNANYSSDEYGALFNKDKTELIQYPTGNSRTSYVVPNGVELICDYAFYYVINIDNSIEYIVLPRSVSTIGDLLLTKSIKIYYFAAEDDWNNISFSDSSAFDSINIYYNYCPVKENHTYVSEIVPPTCTQKGYTSYTCKACNDSYNSDHVPASGHSYSDSLYCDVCNEWCLSYEINNDKVAITECDTSISGGVVIPDVIEGYPVTNIYTDAFLGCKNITSVTIPDGVTYIGFSAFEDCTNLASITIPDSVTSIGIDAFYNTAYYNDENNWKNDVLYIDNHLINAKTTISGSYEIKPGTKTIGYSAFASCSDLTDIKMPDSVIAINESAFYNCSSLTNVIIPDSVTAISTWLFSGCTNLKNVTIPDSVTEIGYEAFIGCDSLTRIEIPDSVTSMSYGVFNGCEKLTSITLPKGITYIDNWTFSDCISLTTITIPDSVTRINRESFTRCSGLTSIVISDNLTIIYDYAFSGCNNIKDVYYTGSESDWNNIEIYEGNDCLTSATIHYNYVDEPPVDEPADGKLNVKNEGGIVTDFENKISQIGKEETVTNLSAMIENENFAIVDKNGNALSEKDLVGTGSKIQLLDNDGKVVNEYTIIVPTDIDGNGKTTAADARLALRSSAKLDTLEGVYNMAADVTGDGKVNASDARKILRISAGLEK